jgi:hypothetical protein
MSDAEVIQSAYESATSEFFRTFLVNRINESPDAEKRFLAGLKILRETRERALKLI